MSLCRKILEAKSCFESCKPFTLKPKLTRAFGPYLHVGHFEVIVVNFVIHFLFWRVWGYPCHLHHSIVVGLAMYILSHSFHVVTKPLTLLPSSIRSSSPNHHPLVARQLDISNISDIHIYICGLV